MTNLDQIIRQVFRLRGDTILADTAGPGDLREWDSVGHVALISAIETTFNITFEIDEMLEIESIADIRNILRAKGMIED